MLKLPSDIIAKKRKTPFSPRLPTLSWWYPMTVIKVDMLPLCIATLTPWTAIIVLESGLCSLSPPPFSPKCDPSPNPSLYHRIWNLPHRKVHRSKLISPNPYEIPRTITFYNFCRGTIPTDILGWWIWLRHNIHLWLTTSNRVHTSWHAPNPLEHAIKLTSLTTFLTVCT